MAKKGICITMQSNYFLLGKNYFVERFMRNMTRNVDGARFHASVFEVHNLNGKIFVKSIRIHTKNLI